MNTHLLVDVISTSISSSGYMVNLPSFVKEILQLPKQISDPLPRDK